MRFHEFSKSTMTKSQKSIIALTEDAAGVLGKLSAIIGANKPIRNLSIAKNLYNPESDRRSDLSFVAALIVGIEFAIQLINQGKSAKATLVVYLDQMEDKSYNNPAVKLATLANDKLRDKVMDVERQLAEYERSGKIDILSKINKLRIDAERATVSQQNQRVSSAPAAVGFN